MSRRGWPIVPAIPAILALLSGCTTTSSAHIDSPAVIKSGKRMASAETYANLAAAYLSEGRVDVALSKAKEALAVDSRNAYANSVMGLVCQRMGHADLAEKHFKRALETEPSNSYYLNAYATLLCSLQRYDEAQKRFEQAADNSLNPTPAVALTNAAICSSRRPDPKQAETFFRRALETDPTFAPALLGMAHLSFDNGEAPGGPGLHPEIRASDRADTGEPAAGRAHRAQAGRRRGCFGL